MMLDLEIGVTGSSTVKRRGVCLLCRLFIKLKHISTTVHQTSDQIH